MGVELTKQALDLGILTRDHDAMMAFYRDALGLPELRVADTSTGEVHFMGIGSSTLKLIRPSVMPAAAAPPGDVTDATGPRYITVRVSNLDEVLADCEQAGASLVWPKKSPSIGPENRVASVTDPDGNIIAFVQDA